MVLGIMSSVGLGTGLHTFVLYLVSLNNDTEICVQHEQTTIVL